ncbi:MAG TPA: efflux RND transporter periplasmic adaptor subunit [Pirellulales bacterium]|nr:efflux RND transporter periplasmic adaptor subunit [Pirellulales bacterium]
MTYVSPISRDTMAVPTTTRLERHAHGAGHLRDDLASLRIDRTRRRGGRPRRFRAFLWLMFLAVSGAGAGGAYWRFEDQFQRLKERFEPAMEVRTEAVRMLSVNQARAVLTATGYLESRRQAAVGTKGTGRIAMLSVDEGKKVRKGDLLAVLEHEDLAALLESRKVAVEQAEAELAQARLALAQRERDFGREQHVNRKGAGTKSALETAETEFKTAKAHGDARAAAVRAAEAHVREAEVAIRNMHVYAPFDATVISKDAELGETIMPGGTGAASGRGSVATLADLGALEVDTDVKEDYLAQIRRGQPADVLVDAVPDRRYRGRLREIIPMGDRTRGIVKVKVEVLDADERLFPELSATIHFLPEEDEAAAGDASQALFVPVAAVVHAEGAAFVWRLAGERAEQVSVTVVGKPRDGLLRVEGALAGGETVIADPPAELTSETKVRAQ